MKMAVVSVRCSNTMSRVSGWAVVLAALLLWMPTALAAPDLTSGTTRFTIDWSARTYCLGPTGLRGWIYTDDGDSLWDWWGGAPGRNRFLDRFTSIAPWQILVTSVGTGTPAFGIIETNDVILGVQSGGGTVAAFTNDTRVELGNAITGAEATNGILRLLVNRYGVPTNQTYTLQLYISNMAYSAMAPYNCPKSALLLSNALKVINAAATTRSRALALLASGDPTYMSKVTTYARSLSAASYVAPWPEFYGAEHIWEMGYRSVFLAEYYMVTNDQQVVTGLVQRVRMLSKCDTLYGAYGHSGSLIFPYHTAAGVPGTSAGYGPVNACGLLASLGVALGKKTGLPGIVTNAEVQPAISRAHKFYNYLVYKGGVNYGESEPNNEFVMTGSGGKNALAALLFSAMGGQPTQVQYFTRLALSGWADMENGHGGIGWCRHWQALGANAGGTNAMATFFANQRWNFELSRRCDGSFAYDCVADVPVTSANYWDNQQYGGSFLDPTAWNALHLACGKQKLYITGKSADPTNTLDAAAISNSLWAAAYPVIKGGYTTNELLSHFSEYLPMIRMWAARELATRPGSNTLVSGLTVLATNANPWVREAAVRALGYTKISTVIPTLAGRMYDTDTWVRWQANFGLDQFGSSVSSQLTNILNSFVMHATPDPLTGVIDGHDPLGWANGYLANILFNTLASSTMAQPTNILNPALEVGLRQPDGFASSHMTTVLNNDSYFPLARVKDLAPTLIAVASKPHQADNMWHGCQANVIDLLARNRIEEGIALSLMAPGLAVQRHQENGDMDDCINNLKNYYRGAASNTVPALISWSNYWAAGGVTKTSLVAMVAATISAVVNDPAPPAVTNFKTFAGIAASPSSFMLPVATSALSTLVTDLDGNPPKYTWKKLSGPGIVSFGGTNNVLAASNCTATFSVPGTYVLQVSASDSSINASNLWVQTTLQWFEAHKIWTNDYGAVTANVTVTVYSAPFVNVTNPNFSVGMTVAQTTIGGTNNTQVAGMMRLVSVANGTTNYTASFAATSPWSAMVSNLANNATNYVTVTGTNGLGVAASDTVEIYRWPLALIDITNSGATVSLPASSNTWRVAGTNNFRVVGGMVWTNAAIGGGNGTLAAAAQNWSFNVALVLGFNPVTIYGTNALGNVATDGVTIIVGEPPMVAITNLSTLVTNKVASTVADQYLAGTNTEAVVGEMRWTNALGGATGTVTRPTARRWNCTATLNHGVNRIIVNGTNAIGAVVADTVTIHRATAPHIDITNANAAVDMNVAATMIGGTNGSSVAGMMRLVSVTGATTNYTATLAATTPWSVMVGNLVPGMTNVVTMIGTNDVNETASDTIQIYRRPLACVDITNCAGIIPVPGTTTTWRVAGTNSLRVVGGMVWTNNLGAGGTLDPVPGNWWFDSPLMPGVNIIIVSGTNAAGDTARDTITVIPGLGWSYEPWTGDADSGITNAYPYHVTVNFGSTAAYVNTIFFEGNTTSGTNFGVNTPLNVFGNDPNNVTSSLARAFVWGASTRTVTLSNLLPNVLYKTTFYSCGWDLDTAGRTQTFAVGSDTLVLDQDIYGANNGVQISHLYQADASGTVTYTITAAAAETFHLYAMATAVLGSTLGADMLAFGPGAVIEGTTVTWPVPIGTSLTNLAPTYQLSPGATCDKASGLTNDFSSPVAYTVVSIDGAATNVYTVTTVWAGSSANKILTFEVPYLLPYYTGIISDTEIHLDVPYGTDITQLAPTYTISPLATCTPASGATNDFTVPVPYTVVAENLSTNYYTVYITVRPEQVWPITNGVTVWLKGDGIDISDTNQVRVVGTNVYVQQWPDASGNGQTATQLTDTNQPAYLAGDFNGYPTVQWKDGNKFLRGPADTTIKTVFFVCKVDTNISGLDGMFCASPDQDSQTIQGDLSKWWAGYGGSYFEYNNTNATRINGAATYYHGRQWHILRMVSATSPSFTYQFGQRAYSRYFNGRVAEVIAYDRALVLDETLAVESYLSNKYWGGLAMVDITNVGSLVSHTNATQEIAGINNTNTVGGMWWTNTLGGGGVLDPSPGNWQFIAPVYVGNNVITVYGTNWLGVPASDCVTVNYAVTPFVDITNENFAVRTGTSAARIGGTNNTGALGSMQLVSMTGATTNYTSVIPAAMTWSAVVSNLVVGMTNVVTVTVTNGVGETATDTIEIYRHAIALVDITNVTGLITVTNNTQYLAGTNSEHVVGMWWTNAPGGGGVIDPAPGTWSFTADLYSGTNVITVYGTNTVGDVVSEAVTVVATLTWPIYRGLNLWLDAAQVAGLTNGQQVDTWADMSGQGNNAIRQGTSSNGFPQYVTNALSMYPALRFSGIDKMGVNLSFLASNSYTIFAIEGKRSAGSSLYLLGTQTAALNQGLHFGYRNNTYFTLAQYSNDLDYNNASLAYTSQVFRRWAGRLDMSFGHSIYLNGAVVATNANTTPFSTANNGFVGVGFNDTIYYNGDIIEIIVYDRALAASEIAEVDRYLWHKYWGTLATIEITNNGSFVSHTNATHYIAGTNNVYTVGGMWWTNTLGGGGVLNPATGSWAFTAAVQPGNNIITIHGTNILGVPASDCVTVNYAVTPFVDITNANFTVNMGTSTATIGGTNNTGPLGSMQLLSMTGGTTNYTCVIPAAMTWSAVVSNLASGVTNVVTVTGTNGIGQAAVDTIEIYRRPIAYVDITNVTGLVDTTDTTQYLAGTNNVHVVRMWWTNTLGGGGTLDPVPGNWSFTVNLSAGTNVITVYGTNTAGDVTTDTVSVRILPLWPVFNGMTVWLKGDGINTGDASQVRIVDTNVYVKQWPDQSGNGQNASQADPTNQPEYLAESLNGYPTLYWDGAITNKTMSGPANTTLKTLFFVCKVDTNRTGYDGIFCQSPNQDLQNIRHSQFDTPLNSWKIHYKANAGDFCYTGSVYVNSVSTNLHNYQWHILREVAGPTPSFTYQLGQRAYSRYFNGRIAEVIAYNRKLIDEEAWAVERYLSNKYFNTPLCVKVTNVASSVGVTSGTQQYLAGTNSPQVVGSLWWTNSLGGGGTLDAAPGTWNFTVPLGVGNNIIVLRGSNDAGVLTYDIVTVTRVPLPYINITNADFVVGMETSATSIGGTNAPGAVVGTMQLVSVAGGVTNYQGTIPAASSWTAAVSNLVQDATNYVTVTGTNLVGDVTSDTVRIYRMPRLGFVDIVNVTNTLSVIYDTQYIGGTNTPEIMGMWWINSAGGGGMLNPFPGTFGFLAPLITGTNVITVRGTNMYGDTASDSVTIVKRGNWTYSPWTSDADSGITNAYSYHVAVNFGSTATFVNAVSFQGTAASGPNFGLGGVINAFNGDSNSNSSSLARDFVFGGFPRTVTISNLVPNAQYQMTFFSVGWEAAGRTQLFASASGDTLVLDQDFYGDNQGVKVSYTFDAPANGVQQFSMTPLKPGYSFHMYAMAVAQTPRTRQFVDITNVTGIINVPSTTTNQYIAGTNSTIAVGMWWTNSTGGGGAIDPAPGNWNFNAPLVPGVDNVISVSGTNSAGDVYADPVVVRSVLPPYVNITNNDFSVGMEITATRFGGTNNGGWVVGGMRVVGVAGGVTNYQGSTPAAPSWTAVVSNLVIGATNYVTVTGTNLVGEAASDSVQIYRRPQLGYVDIVNVTGTVSVLYDMQYYISGTNTPTISGMWWTNTLGGGGMLDSGPGAFGFFTPLSYGSNVITVRGTNVYGDTASDTVTILKRGTWTYGPWTCDEDSGITNAYSYHVAVNFASTAVYVNGAFFQEAATSGPNFGVNLPMAFIKGDPNNVTGSLAHDFVYAVSPRTVTISNLVANARYQATFFSVGWEASGRSQTFASASDTLVLDQDIYGDNQGVKVSYTFDGPQNGVQQFTMTAFSANTFHLYALAVAQKPKLFVDITNAAFTVNAGTTVIGGTNTAVVGAMRLASVTGTTTNYAATLGPTASWTAAVSNLVIGATNVVTVTATNVTGEMVSDTVQIYRPLGDPNTLLSLSAGRGADYGQVALSWSNGVATVLACTNRTYSTNAADWFVLAADVATPWTHAAASNYASVYYRIVNGMYTSTYAVGKYDVQIAAGSIAWLSFPFGVQAGCDIVAEWFGQQLEVRPYTSFDFPGLQRQTTPGGTIENSDYFFDDFGDTGTNWFPARAVVANAGYVLFLPQDHGAVKVTGLGMVQTNNVTLQIPYKSIPWVGLAYDVVMDMRSSGLTNMLQPPRLYSSFNYDFVDSQQTPGGSLWYAEYYIDNWGGGAVDFFPSQAGADMLEPGKGYLLFFSTGRAGTGTWTCIKPY